MTKVYVLECLCHDDAYPVGGLMDWMVAGVFDSLLAAQAAAQIISPHELIWKADQEYDGASFWIDSGKPPVFTSSFMKIGGWSISEHKMNEMHSEFKLKVVR